MRSHGSWVSGRFRRYWLFAIVCAALVVLSEVFFFNAAHWKTRNVLAEPSAAVSVQVRRREVVARLPRLSDVYTVRITPQKSYPRAQQMSVQIRAGGKWQTVQSNLIVTQGPKTQFVLTRFGACDAVRLRAQNRVKLHVARVSINERVPLVLSPLRILTGIICLCIAFVMRPSSRIYRLPLQWSAATVSAYGLLIAFSLMTVWLLVSVSGPVLRAGFSPESSHWQDPRQYDYLADSLVHGRTWLDLPVPRWLSAMGNPYDAAARQAHILTTHDKVYWDYAFFHGRYYTYFGVIPAVILFLPFQLITRHQLPTWVAVGIFASLFIVLLTFLLVEALKKWFPATSLGFSLLLAAASILGSNIYTYCFDSRFYSIPMVSAMMFAAAGILLWIAAWKSPSDVSYPKLVCGSLCIAAIAGCRPQFLTAALFIVFLAWPTLRDPEVTPAKKWSIVAAVVIPAVIIAIPLMAYNMARFGSVTDFGALYNLTGFDMTKTRLSAYLLPLAVFLQLFQPTATATSFPFIVPAANAIDGPHEPSVGGLFAIFPLLFSILLLPLIRRLGVQKNVRGLAWYCALIPLPVALFDIYLCGLSNRYFGDYVWLWLFDVVVILAAIEQQCFNRESRVASGQSDDAPSVSQEILHYTVVILVVLCLIASATVFAAGLFMNGRYLAMQQYRPEVYARVASWFLGLAS